MLSYDIKITDIVNTKISLDKKILDTINFNKNLGVPFGDPAYKFKIVATSVILIIKEVIAVVKINASLFYILIIKFQVKKKIVNIQCITDLTT